MSGETIPAAPVPPKPEPTEEEKAQARAMELIPLVETALTKDRLKKLSKQPMCIARDGGMDAVMMAACRECVGFEKPVLSAAIRVLQLCGSTATPEDLKI